MAAKPERVIQVPDNPNLEPGDGPFTIHFRYRTQENFGNITQKGQAQTKGGQWKIQAPQGIPTCLFKGSGGQVATGAKTPLNDEQWHDGGSIFATLEQGAPEYIDRFDRLFGTPHGVDLASLCAATRTPHWRVESLPELEQALATPNGGIEVVEVRVRRDNRRELDQRIRQLGHPAQPGNRDQAAARDALDHGRMADDDDRSGHVRGVRRHPRRGARRPRGDRRRAGAEAALLALPLRPDDQVRRRRAAAGPPPAHPARARGVPHDHHPRPAHRHRGRGGLRVARGVHPGVQAGVRRDAGHLAQEARAPPDRRAQRRPLPPTRQHPAARTRRGHPHGAADEDGRAPHLAHRRDGAARRAPDR